MEFPKLLTGTAIGSLSAVTGFKLGVSTLMGGTLSLFGATLLVAIFIAA